MAEHSSMLHVRIDDETKALATEALAAMGLAISDGGAAVPAPCRDRSGLAAGDEGAQRRDPRRDGRVPRHAGRSPCPF